APARAGLVVLEEVGAEGFASGDAVRHHSWSRTVAACPWRPPLETASDCLGQEALDKASYVGLYWPCRAGALAPRQLLKDHTASSREGPLHRVAGHVLVLGVEGRCARSRKGMAMPM